MQWQLQIILSDVGIHGLWLWYLQTHALTVGGFALTVFPGSTFTWLLPNF